MAVKVYCPHCKVTRLVAEAQLGTEVMCAGCGERYLAEKSAGAPPAGEPEPIPGAGPSPRRDHNRGNDRPPDDPPRRRRPRADPARALVGPALCLSLYAAFELVCLLAAMFLLDKVLAARGGEPGPRAAATFELLAIGLVACGVKLGLVFLGAWQMWSRHRYGLAVLGAIAAVFPIELTLSVITETLAAGSAICSGCWSLLWFGFGGWALALLFQHDIAARFDNPDAGPESPA